MDFDFTLPGLGRPESSRPKRVAEAIKHELRLLLLQRVSDPRLQGVSISHVIVAPDLKQAKVYYVVSPGEKIKPVEKAIHKARGFFRTHIARALNLRFTPDLLFYHDDQNDELERIGELFRQIEKERKINGKDTPSAD